MPKQRYIDTRFWHDSFVQEQLNPLDRYLFLYFLTNDKTSICGVYELPLTMMANETGLTKEILPKMLKRLKGRVDYLDGWVVIRNFQKYQATTNPKIQKGIENEMSRVPSKIRDKIAYPYDMDRQSHLNLNTNTNTNTTVNKSLTGMSNFEGFWGIYPNKKSKKTAEKAWSKISPSRDLQQNIISALELQKRSEQWTRDGGRYVPYAATWLNGERWKDEVDVKPVNNFLYKN